jgi:hypothetical protein
LSESTSFFFRHRRQTSLRVAFVALLEGATGKDQHLLVVVVVVVQHSIMTIMEEEKTSTPEEEKTTTAKPATKKKVGQPSASEDGAAPYPDMEICQSIHQLTTKCLPEGTVYEELKIKVYTQIAKELENPSLFKSLQSTFGGGAGVLDEAVTKELETKHTKHLEELESKVEEAKESAGDMEVMDARLEIARFATKCLSKEEALGAYKKLLALPKISSGKKIDSLMESSRVASFYGDAAKSDEFIESVS